ncbi:MAG: glycosyltransferase family 4 protein [Candidatus Acidiferrales bacterium]
MTKVLCIFTRILGWNVFGGYVEEALLRRAKSEYCFVNFGGKEIYSIPVPKFAKLSNDVDSFWRIKRYISRKQINIQDYGAYIFVSHQLAVPFFRSMGAKPLVLVMDTTPILANIGNRRTESTTRQLIKQCFIRPLNFLVYRPLFKRVNAFLVLSQKAKTSLMQDYGVPGQNISIIHPPIYHLASGSAERKTILGRKTGPRMLFIGNDFARKGGYFLLDLFAKFFAGKVELVVVSNDQSLKDESLPPGVIRLRDIPHDEILYLYEECDLFLFPTWKDELGLVCSEAILKGLPIIARDANAQDEFVKDGYNGFLMPYASDDNAWVEAINKILYDEALRTTFSRNSRILAEKMLRLDTFDAAMAEQLDRFNI